MVDLLGLEDLRVSGCREVDRNFFGTGPDSSADERGLDIDGWVKPVVGT